MMIQKYPVQLSRREYGGQDEAKRDQDDEFHQLCSRVEDYLNRTIERWPDDEWRTVLASDIAKALGATLEDVAYTLGGDNEITCGR